MVHCISIDWIMVRKKKCGFRVVLKFSFCFRYRWIADINMSFFTFKSIMYNEVRVSFFFFCRFAIAKKSSRNFIPCLSQFYNVTFNCTQGINCPFTTGNQLLVYRGIDLNLNLGLQALYILIVWACFHFISCLAVNFLYTNTLNNLSCCGKKADGSELVEKEPQASSIEVMKVDAIKS